jgi:hypothetical protein
MPDYLEPLDRWAATLNVSDLLRTTSQALYNSRKLAEGKLNAIVLIVD